MQHIHRFDKNTCFSSTKLIFQTYMKYEFDFGRILGNIFGNVSNNKSAARKAKQQRRGRISRIEELENREMLSVNMLSFSLGLAPENVESDTVLASDSFTFVAGAASAEGSYEDNGYEWTSTEDTVTFTFDLEEIFGITTGFVGANYTLSWGSAAGQSMPLTDDMLDDGKVEVEVTGLTEGTTYNFTLTAAFVASGSGTVWEGKGKRLFFTSWVDKFVIFTTLSATL